MTVESQGHQSAGPRLEGLGSFPRMCVSVPGSFGNPLKLSAQTGKVLILKLAEKAPFKLLLRHPS